MRIRNLALGAAALLAALALLAWHFLRFESPPAPDLPGTLESVRLEHEGRPRSAQVYRPARLAPRPALVLVFHGSLGEGAQARSGFGYAFDALAEEHGFLVAYPDGYERHWNGCRKAGPYAANLEGVDDVGFALHLVEELARRHGVDRATVFATGVSNGGQMALRLAFEAPEAFRAVAPVIAGQPSRENQDCTPSGRPISIAFLNGTEDPMNPYEGGTVALYGIWGDRGEVLSTQASVAYWRDLAGHAGPGERRWLEDANSDDGSRIEETSWRAPGRPLVRLLAVHGGGHTVPHPERTMPRLLGRTNRDHRAADLIWRFFSESPAL